MKKHAFALKKSRILQQLIRKLRFLLHKNHVFFLRRYVYQNRPKFIQKSIPKWRPNDPKLVPKCFQNRSPRDIAMQTPFFPLFLAVFGASWKRSRRILAILRPFWDILGASWGIFGRFGCQEGPILAPSSATLWKSTKQRPQSTEKYYKFESICLMQNVFWLLK